MTQQLKFCWIMERGKLCLHMSQIQNIILAWKFAYISIRASIDAMDSSIDLSRQE